MSNSIDNLFIGVRKIVALGVVCMMLLAVVGCENTKEEMEEDCHCKNIDMLLDITYYMYVGAEKHIFDVVANKMMFQFFDYSNELARIKGFLQKMGIETTKTTLYRGSERYEFMLIEMENISKEQVICLAVLWDALGEDANLSPILSREDSIQISFVPNQFSVRIKHEDDNSLLLQKLESYPVKSIEPCSFIPGLYRITLSEAHHRTSIQIASELHRSGLFKNAAPEVLMFIERGI